MRKKTKRSQPSFFSCCQSKTISILLIMLIVFLLSLIVVTAVDIQNKIRQGRYIGQDTETKNTITVSGSGEIYAKPDLALATFSVKSEADTVAEAMAENTKKMNAIISLIKGQGVESKDLKTIGFNIYPRYEYRKEETNFLPPQPQGKRVLVGYEAIQSLQVKIRDMENIGDIIQLATGAGANQVGSLRFTIDNEDELKKRARKEAIQEAKEKAEELAGQLGVELVRITNFSESGTVPFRYYDYPLPKAVATEEEAAAPQIETGENKIEVAVSITYEIN